LEAPGASVAFAAKAPLADVDDDKAEPANTTEAMRAVLSEWMASYSEDEMAFASKAVFIEMRLRQALACSASIGVPNQFRCAIVCLFCSWMERPVQPLTTSRARLAIYKSHSPRLPPVKWN
jgi:hypothetical protein